MTTTRVLLTAKSETPVELHPSYSCRVAPPVRLRLHGGPPNRVDAGTGLPRLRSQASIRGEGAPPRTWRAVGPDIAPAAPPDPTQSRSPAAEQGIRRGPTKGSLIVRDYIIHVGVTVPDASVVDRFAERIEDELRDWTGIKDWDVWHEPSDYAVEGTKTQGGAS